MLFFDLTLESPKESYSLPILLHCKLKICIYDHCHILTNCSYAIIITHGNTKNVTIFNYRNNWHRFTESSGEGDRNYAAEGDIKIWKSLNLFDFLFWNCLLFTNGQFQNSNFLTYSLDCTKCLLTGFYHDGRSCHLFISLPTVLCDVQQLTDLI